MERVYNQISALGAECLGFSFHQGSELDIALGIANMVAETIFMMSIFAARSKGISDIVLTGNLTTIAPIRSVFEGLASHFGVRFIIPENSSFGTVIGAALYEG